MAKGRCLGPGNSATNKGRDNAKTSISFRTDWNRRASYELCESERCSAAPLQALRTTKRDVGLPPQPAKLGGIGNGAVFYWKTCLALTKRRPDLANRLHAQLVLLGLRGPYNYDGVTEDDRI